MGDKLGGKTKWVREKGRQGGHTIQQREGRIKKDKLGDKLGDKRGQAGDKLIDKEGKALGRADTPSNKGTRVGRRLETRGDKTWAPSNRHTCGEATGDKARQGETRPRTRHPTQAHM